MPTEFDTAFACLLCGARLDEEDEACEISVLAPAGIASFRAHAACLRKASHDPDHFPDLVTPATPPPGWEPPTEAELAARHVLDELLADLRHADLDLEQTLGVVAELRRIVAPLCA